MVTLLQKHMSCQAGVLQGTVLGPLLFLIFINDLPQQVTPGTTRLFSDDCLVYREIRTPEDHATLQRDLSALENWSTKWGNVLQSNQMQHHEIAPFKDSQARTL